MLALSQLSADATAALYVIAFFALAVAAVIAWVQRATVIALVATGLALTTLVAAWNACAATG